MSDAKTIRLSDESHEGPYNTVVAMLTESDIQTALGDNMPPDPSPNYQAWETAISAISSTDEGKRLIQDYLLAMAGELADMVAEQMAGDCADCHGEAVWKAHAGVMGAPCGRCGGTGYETEATLMREGGA